MDTEEYFYRISWRSFAMRVLLWAVFVLVLILLAVSAASAATGGVLQLVKMDRNVMIVNAEERCHMNYHPVLETWVLTKIRSGHDNITLWEGDDPDIAWRYLQRCQVPRGEE